MTHVKNPGIISPLTSVSHPELNNSPFPANLICFSHLRWDFVYQRPQHLLSRFARTSRTFFIEEPVFDSDHARYQLTTNADRVTVVVPHLPAGTSPEQSIALQQQLLDGLLSTIRLEDTAFWYYTPMALKFSSSYKPKITIFDCMDELSAFKDAPQELKDLEATLMRRADVVFTGGYSLYHAKRHRHHNIHAFPSSIDKDHFGQARLEITEPADQQQIPHPRLGFFGVIDERFDVDLIDNIAKQRPDLQIVLIGPVVKIDPAILPRRDNIHYLGGRQYADLPAYLSGWDIALIPFQRNDSTKFISPTKTPEYLAAGIPVISTPITDVVAPYGDAGLVYIADTAEGFLSAADTIMYNKSNRRSWLREVDSFLAGNSWDQTYECMARHILDTISSRKILPITEPATKVA